MTAAGVQNIDSTAYVHPSPSSSAPDSKATSAAGKSAADPQAADSQGQPSDFQSELELQNKGTQDSEPAVSPKTGPEKSGTGKTGKKRDARPDDSNILAVTPAQQADPQRPILPFTLTFPQLQKDTAHVDAEADVNTKLDEHAASPENLPEPAMLPVPPTPISIAAATLPIDVSQPTTPGKSAKDAPLAMPMETQRSAAARAIPSAMSDASKAPRLVPGLPLPAQPFVQTGQEDQNQTIASAKTSESSQSQPASPIELNLPSVPPERMSRAVRETADSAPSSPSALAFAARVTAAAGKTNQAIAANAEQGPAVQGPQTPPQIPIRYAAMAQIIQNAMAGNKDDGPKKDAGAAFDPAFRVESSSNVRLDMIAPQTGTANQPSPFSPSAPAAPPPAQHMEHIIEPPAAPPASNHDIRVRVPDNNGGSTQVRFVESGGEVRVSVRTSDDGLAQNLRTHLNDLTQRLSDGGMPAEIWRPASNGTSSQNDQHSSNQDGGRSGGQGSGSQGGHQDRQQKRPAWLEEMEASLHAKDN